MDETRGNLDDGKVKEDGQVQREQGVGGSSACRPQDARSPWGEELAEANGDARAEGHTQGPELGANALQQRPIAERQVSPRDPECSGQVLQAQPLLETGPARGGPSYGPIEGPGQRLAMRSTQNQRMDQEEADSRSGAEDDGLRDCFTHRQDQLLEKYLVSAALRDGHWAQHSLGEEAGDYGYWRDGEDPDGSAFIGSDCDALDGSSEEEEEEDLGKALLVQQCRDLAAQLEDREARLEDREKQLGEFQGEARSAAQGLQEALEKGDEVRRALEAAQRHLQAERELRQRSEEAARRGTQEAAALRAELSFLQSQLDRKGRAGEEALGLLAELREEKELLLSQLRGQEQLVWDVQEQKLAGDSVINEVQALFGRQLSVLQEQRDRLQGMLDLQQTKNLTASQLLGQRTLELDSSLKEVLHLRAQLAEREERSLRVGEAKQDLESKLLGLQQDLVDTEQALSRAVENQAARDAELEIRAKNAENSLETARAEFRSRLEAWDLEVRRLEAERGAAEAERREEVSALRAELERVRESLRERDGAHAVAVETLLQSEAEKLHSAVEEAVAQLRTVHQEETDRLRDTHQEQVKELKEEMERKQSELKAVLGEEQKSWITLIKQVHEREHQREMDRLVAEQEAELSRLGAELKESLETAHQTELVQAETQHALELEALRLSLANQHAAQLELCQSAQQRHQEAALSELQESLRARWSQDSTLLQEQHQAQLESLREENQNQARRAQQQHQQEKDDLNLAWETRMLEEKIGMEEQQANQIEALRAESQAGSDRALEQLRSSLSETQEALAAGRAQLEELRASREAELQRLEAELNRARSESDHAARANADLVAGHQGALQEQQDRAQHLEELCSASTEREHQLQLEVERLQAEHMTLKSSSEQEVGRLQAQLECMRVRQQELEGLREQLKAELSQQEEAQRLQQELSQQRQEIQRQNEEELQNLRSYFEQRLCIVEENHREEVALLQRRLAERPEESSAPQDGNDSFLCEGDVEEEKADMLAEINQKLENHKEELDSLRLQLEERHRQELEHLRCSLALSQREELLQVKTHLTERYFSQIQELKTKHSLELEQQRATLSESHVREISRLRLQSAQDAARQVEREVQERSRMLAEEHRARMAQVRSETGRIRGLEARLAQLQNSREEQLRQAEELHGEQLRTAQERLKQDFAEQLQEEVLKVRLQEEERLRQELSQEKEEALDRLRAELQMQAEGRFSALREELERAAAGEREALQEQLEEARSRARSPQGSPESERDPRNLAARQRMEAQFQRELLTAKQLMAEEVKELNTVLLEQAEARLQEAQRRFEKEQQELEEKLGLKQEEALRELSEKHREELESQKALLPEHVLSPEHRDHRNPEEGLQHEHQTELDSLRAELQAKHRAELDSLGAELQAKRRAELDSLKAELHERSQAQLEAQEAELRARLKGDRDELEARMLSNMDTLEAAYLAQIQEARAERDGVLEALRELERGHTVQLDRLRTKHQAQLGLLCIELRRELDLVLMDKPCATTANALGSGRELSAGTPRPEGEPEEVSEEAPEKGLEETHFVDSGGPGQWLGDLLSKLKADLRTVAEQRRGLQEAHRQLQEVLQEVVRRTVATEEEIQQRLRAAVEPGVSCGAELREVLPDSALWAVLRDDGLGLSLRLQESLASGLGLQPEEVEQVVLGLLARLRSSVDRLLDRLQPHPQRAQVPVQEKATQRRAESDSSPRQPLHAPEQLDVHKEPAEFSAVEQATLQEVLEQKEARVQELVEELEGREAQLQELREERALLLRQREALVGPLGDTERGLLEEAQRLLQEKVEVQRQAERDWGRLASRLRLMEEEVEEQDSSRVEEEQQRRAQLEDLQLQVTALERQLRHHRQFIHEQTVEREQEREEFQQEIRSLEARLRRPSQPRPGGGGREDKIEDLVLQVEALQAAVREKTADHAQLLLTKEKYWGDLAEQNEQIHKMAARICELEQALLGTAQPGPTLDLQEGEQDRAGPRLQLCSSCLQVYAQQRRPDYPPGEELWPPRSGAEQALEGQLQALQVELLSAGLGQAQPQQEHKHPAPDLEQPSLWESTNQNSDSEHGQCGLHQTNGQKDSSLVLLDPLNRLEEESQEIQRLRGEVLRLQREADASKEEAAEEARAELEEAQREVEALRSRVEHLLGDRARLRQDREEEVERLHEVIHKLQEELEQMGPTRLEVSTSPECSPAPPLLHAPRGLDDSLRQELTRHAPVPDPRGEPSSKTPREEAREGTGLAWVEEDRSRVRAGLTQRQREAGLEDERRPGHALSPGAGPLMRREGEGREGAPTGPSRKGGQKTGTPEAEEPAVDGRVPAETLRMDGLQTQVREGQTKIHDLETENQQLRQSQGLLQEEVERLRQEVTSERAHIQHRGVRMAPAQDLREVLVFAEETLAKAERALQEKEEHLAQVEEEHEALKEEHEALKEEHGVLWSGHKALKEEHGALKVDQEALKEEHGALKEEHETLKEEHEALKEEHRGVREEHDALWVEQEALKEEHDALWAEHGALKMKFAAVPQELSSSTPRPEKLAAESQTEDGALAELEIRGRRPPCGLQGLAGQQGEPESQGEAPELAAVRKFDSALSRLSRQSSLHPPELHSSPLSHLSSPLSRASSGPPGACSTPHTHSCSSSEALSTPDSPDDEQGKTLDDRYFTGLEEWASDGYSGSISPDGGSTLSLDGGSTVHQQGAAEPGLSSSFLQYLRARDMAVEDRMDSATESMGQDAQLLSPDLQGWLKRVYREGHRVLRLSERPVPVTVTTPSPPQAPPPGWQAERRALQQTVLSLRELLCKMADREPQLDSGDADGRRELQQALRSVFHSERAAFGSELQAALGSALPQQLRPITAQLEKLLGQQEVQRRQHLEQLLTADRLALLEEVQALRSLLSASSQEQLRLLQTSSRTSREQGSQCQLGDRLEPCVTERLLGRADLRATQGDEHQQSMRSQRSCDADRQTLQEAQLSLEERAAQISALREEVERERAENRSLRSQLQNEQSHCAASIAQESSRAREALRLLEEERASHTHSQEEEVQRRHEALRLLEEERASHTHRLEEEVQRRCEMLKQLEEERVSHTRNLEVEVQRRCETLKQLEEERVSHAKNLEEERASHAHSLEGEVQRRREALRQLEEEAQQHKEATSQDRKFIEELQVQLEQEQRQSEELAAATERVHQRAIHTQRQLEEEVRRRREAADRQQEAVDRLQALKLENALCLEEEVQRRCEATEREQEAVLGLKAERHRANQLQAQLDRLREEVRSMKEERRRVRRQEEQGERERKQRLVKSPDCVSLSQSAAPQAARCDAGIELQLRAEVTHQPSNSKMQRLYCKYLRAESFRKALVFQKKYLLLLLSGFLDSEGATLALIASMGACPSPAAPPTPPRPVTRFRTAALVVIAVSRLCFLVRKWQRAFRMESARSSELRHAAGPGIRTELQRRQQPPPAQSAIPTGHAQPHSTGRGHGSAPVRHVSLQPVQRAQLQNIAQKSN